MKPTFLILAVFFVISFAKVAVSEVESCYVCPQSKTWDECKKSQTKSSCIGKCGIKMCDACMKLEVKSYKEHIKECTMESFCKSAEDYFGIHTIVAKSWCCTDDDCNRSSGIMASVGVITAVGLMTIIKITLF